MGRIKIDFANLAFIEIPVMQDDTYTRNLSFDMLYDGSPFTPSTIFGEGYGYRIDYVKRADGTKGRYEKLPDDSNAVTENGSKITVHIAPQVLTKAGDVIMNIVIYKNADGKALRSFPIVLKVYQAAVRDDEPSEDYWNVKSLADVTAALAEVESDVQAMSQTLAAAAMREVIAPDYDASNEYSPGAYCFHNGALLQNISGETVSGAWDSSKWNEVQIAGQLADLEGQIANTAEGLLMIALSYNSTKTYVQGEFCVYDAPAKLYRCTTPITTPENWTAAHWEEVTVGAELQGKAVPDGNYPNMTVGKAALADNLDSKVGLTDTAPYNLRTTGGSLDVGGRLQLVKLVGMTLKWNQMIRDGNFSSGTDYWVPNGNYGQPPNGSIAAADGVLTYTVDSVQNTMYGNAVRDSVKKTLRAGHKYLSSYRIWVPRQSKVNLYYIGSAYAYKIVPAGWSSLSTIFSPNADVYESAYFGIRDASSYGYEVGDSYKLKDVLLIDLTDCFGATIADYLATLESGTAGAGVSWFRKYFPKAYYAYDAGSRKSVKAASHVNIGFNLLDGATGKATLVGGMTHQITGTYTAIAFTPFGGSAATVTPDSDGKFTPGADGELTVTGGGTDTCVHLVWDGERDGELEAYEAHTYSLGSDELRGFPELDGNGNFTTYGDEKTPDGTITRKVGSVDLGTINWSYDSQSKYFYPTTQDAIPTPQAEPTDAARVMMLGYDTVSFGAMDVDLTMDKVISVGQDFCMRDLSYTDPAAFKTAMSGKALLFELETPTTESGTPYTEVQLCDNWGTQQFVDAGVAAGTRDVAIPVGHESWYPNDLRAKLETLPSVPASDGEYALNADGGDYTYRPLAQTQAVGGLLERCPEAPTEDGTYVLKSVVSSGVKTYSWVAETP